MNKINTAVIHNWTGRRICIIPPEKIIPILLGICNRKVWKYTFHRKKKKMISYEPLFETMKQKNISSYYLIKHGLSKGTYESIRQGKLCNLITIDRLCKLLDCNVSDIITYIPD